MAGGLQDDVSHKIIGQGTVVGELLGEAVQFLLGGQLAQQQQIGGLLEAKAVLPQGARHQLFHVHSTVI